MKFHWSRTESENRPNVEGGDDICKWIFHCTEDLSATVSATVPFPTDASLELFKLASGLAYRSAGCVKMLRATCLTKEILLDNASAAF